MKALAIFASLTAIVAVTIASHLFRLTYERVSWHGPTTLVRETWSRPDLEGLWTGTFYNRHDCLNSCETRERVQLNIQADSTARLVIAIDTLDMIFVPFTDVVYAKPKLWRVSANDARLQPDRLVMDWDTSIGIPFEHRGDSLFFDSIGSWVSSY